MAGSYRTNVVLCELYDLVRSPIELIIGIGVFNRLSVNGGCWVYSDAAYRKVVLSLNDGGSRSGASHVSGLFARRTRPLALM
jgi:hypothetical protein